MPNSYLPSGVYVNCTFMTVTTPQHLGVNRSRITALIKGKDAALLNIEDKKISDSFACKSPVKFWLGLAALCAGIAISIFLTAAVIGTGSAALVAIVAVAAAAVTTSAVSVGVSLYKRAHDCDCTLKSQWILPHNNVEINGAKALLQRSFLQCKNGGMVQPFMNSAIAAHAAAVFANNNNTEIKNQLVSQFAIGVVSMISTLGDPLSAVLGGGLSVYSYITEYDVDEKAPFVKDLSDFGKDTVRDNAIGLLPNMASASKEVTKLNRTMIAASMESGMPYAVASGSALGIGEVGKRVGKSIGAGLVGCLINFGISQLAKRYKKEHIENVKKELEKAKIEDSINSSDIIAKT